MALDTPALIAKLPTVGRCPLDAQGFAWSLGEAARKMQAEHDPTGSSRSQPSTCRSLVRADRFAIFEADWDRYRLRARVLAGKRSRRAQRDGHLARPGHHRLGVPPRLPVQLPGHPQPLRGRADPRTGRVDPGGVHARRARSSPATTASGVIDMWRNGLAQFTEEDLERCALFGYITAAAWRNAQLYAELELRAMTDTLTGLLNHRWWDELATREAARSSRAGTQIGILDDRPRPLQTGQRPVRARSR